MSIAEPAPPPFSPVSQNTTLSNVEVETKAALSGVSKGESSKSAEDEEAPPPYTEGSSPLESFTYVMAAAGGAASIITQVQQGNTAPVNTLAGMTCPVNEDTWADIDRKMLARTNTSL